MVIPGVKPAEEVIKRYPKLHKRVIAVLTDLYNQYIALELVARGDEAQMRLALELLDDKIQDGRDAFLSGGIDYVLPDVTKSLERKDGDFSQDDLDHLLELKQLVKYANEKALTKTFTKDVALEIYAILIPYLYGRLPK